MADPFAELQRLIDNLGELAENGTDTVATSLEPAVQQLLDQEYEQGRGPSGETWAAKADGTPSHLQKTGAMRAGSQVIPGVKGVSVRIPKPGGFHQDGTTRMQARPLVPEGEPLPEAWSAAVQRTSESTISSILKK